MTQRIRGVLFDMDDTLIDWSEYHQGGDWRATERPHLRKLYDFVQNQHGKLNASFDAFANYYNSRVREAWSDARTSLRAPHLGLVVMDCLAHFGYSGRLSMDECLRAYEWGVIERVHVFADTIPALSELTARGIALGIVTNAYQPMWMRDLELLHYGLLDYFPNPHARISAADAGYLKPHAAIFERALRALGLPPDEVIFVGDNPVADIAGAQHAGMRAVWRQLPNAILANPIIVPDATIHTLQDLIAVIEAWEAA